MVAIIHVTLDVDIVILLSVSTAGFKLTPAGYQELRKRNLVTSAPKYLGEYEDMNSESVDSASIDSVPDISLEFDNPTRVANKPVSVKQEIKETIKSISKESTDDLELYQGSSEDETIVKKVEKAVKNFVQQEILNVGVGVGVKLAMEAARRVF